MQAPTAEVQAVLEVHSEVDEGEGMCISFTFVNTYTAANLVLTHAFLESFTCCFSLLPC